jgi:hypothetical protein
MLEANGRPDLATVDSLRRLGFSSFLDLADLAAHVDVGEDVIRERVLMAASSDAYRAELRDKEPRLTAEQSAHSSAILESVRLRRGGIFFIDGKAGRGKSWVTRCITARARLGDFQTSPPAPDSPRIVMIVASTGVAALDHDRGMTAHSTFQIPCNEHGEEVVECECGVGDSSARAELIKAADLLIWDELPMQHRLHVEAVDRLLRRLRGKPDMPFGGITVVGAGDFRQTVPVVPGMSSGDAIAASIRCSYIWKHFKVLTLTKRLRDAGDPEFSEWVDGVGNGELGDAAGPTGNIRMVTMPTFKRRCVECTDLGRPCIRSIATFTAEKDALAWLAPGHDWDI